MLELSRVAVDTFGQTLVMVTHDARAASYADRVVFLADGRIVSELGRSTMAAILDELKRIGE
jgi:putative ABC transport system ATP-binding protein